MYSKTLLIFFVVYFLSGSAHALNGTKVFREDYTYIESEESFYKVHTTAQTFADAKRMCAHEGARLFYAEDVDEANAVLSFWNGTQPNIPWVFVGLSDITAEGLFETVDGRPITEVYSLWHSRQPDNFRGKEDCVQMDLQGTMNDYLCDSKCNFICKKSDQSPKQNNKRNEPHLGGQRDKKFFRKDYSYIESEESFYKVHTTAQTFADAKRMCAHEGARLFYAEDVDEANAVLSFWNGTQPNIPWVFVGLSDITAEGLFETVDGRPITEVYSLWHSRQPDNFGGEEDCVQMDLQGTMNDYLCDSKCNFICKKSDQSPKQNNKCNEPHLGGQRDKKFFRKDYSYIESEESFYKVHTTAQTFADAKRMCAHEGARLFYAEDVDEANAVLSFWNGTQPNIPWVFVGLSDITAEGLFETVDGRPITEVYSLWHSRQPDNFRGKEDCVQMDLQGTMNDYLCDSKCNFICKKSDQSPKQNNKRNEPHLGGQRDKKFFRKDYSYIESEESFYKVHTTAQTFADAKRMCAHEGARLFYAEDVDEANAVLSFWNGTQPNIPWVFVGLSDITAEGLFETVDGRPITEVYSLWHSRQPDNFGGEEDCVQMDLQGTMNDYLCDSKCNFICKKSDQSPKQNNKCNEPHLGGQRDKKFFRKDYSYIESEESFFKVHTTAQTFADAKRMCAHEGARLFYAEDVDEANAVLSFWNGTQPNIPWVFVGLSDITAEGLFETVDGRPITEVYSLWHSRQPDNFRGEEDCVQMDLQGTMNDYLCDSKCNFICKKSDQSPKQNKKCNEPHLGGQRDKKFFRKDYSYIESEESFYKVHTTAQTFADAKRMCAHEGARLFYAEDVDEANAVLSFWNGTQPNIPWVFVGLSDITAEGLFETVDGRPITEVYSLWHSRQPDNFRGEEDCVQMDLQGTMNDYLCDSKCNFICKKSDQSPKQNKKCNEPHLGGQRDKKFFRKDYSYIESEESFYKVHTTAQTFADAKRMCAHEGARLFYAEDVDEANAVLSFWNGTQPNIPWVFVGLSDITAEGLFETVDGRPITEVYSLWHSRQPDNFGGEEDCVQMDLQGTMNDYLCDSKCNFICKKSDQSPKQNNKCNEPHLGGQRDKKFFRKDYSYIESEESFYKVHTTAQTFADAKRMCAHEGARLFYAEDVDEANAVLSFWNGTQPNIPWVFVGLSDITAEGLFETVDGRPITEVYSLWHSRQPDNFGGEEDCVQMDLQGTMNDYLCDSKCNFICKKSDQSPKQNNKCNEPHLGGQRDKKFFRKDYSYIESEESFYKVHTTAQTFADAKRMCAHEGARLFYAEDVDEANAVLSFWNGTQPNIPWVFVGLSDITAEGLFETVDGRPITEVYSLWHSRQPDNFGGEEDCVQMDLQGTMNDYLCDSKCNFICKKSDQSPKQNNKCNEPHLGGQRDKKFFRKDYSYIESEESFYKVHTTAQTFADAKRMCVLEGASLFYAEDVDEANAVISFWNGTQPNIPWVFVGLSDIMAEGLFETVDGRPIADVYSLWQSTQPDNFGGKEDCVHMDKLGTMNDYLCDSKAYFICKKRLKSLEWNYNCNMANLDYTFSKDTGKCYKLHTTPMNWADAYAMCRIEYTSLAVINYPREANYLEKLTRSMPKPLINNQHQRGIYHLGFHNRFNEGWQTVRGTPMNVDADAWFDHYQPDGHLYEECGSMFFNGRLINTDCDMKSLFICEHDVDDTNSLESEKIY